MQFRFAFGPVLCRFCPGRPYLVSVEFSDRKWMEGATSHLTVMVIGGTHKLIVELPDLGYATYCLQLAKLTADRNPRAILKEDGSGEVAEVQAS
jgi:hypothetical protein